MRELTSLERYRLAELEHAGMKAAFADGLVGGRKSDKALIGDQATAYVDAIQSPGDPFLAARREAFNRAMAFRVSLGGRTGKGDDAQALAKRFANVAAKKLRKAGIELGGAA